MNSVVLEVRCENEECGMVSAFRFWPDGSFQRVMDACHHAKRWPSRAKIQNEIKKEEGEK